MSCSCMYIYLFILRDQFFLSSISVYIYHMQKVLTLPMYASGAPTFLYLFLSWFSLFLFFLWNTHHITCDIHVPLYMYLYIIYIGPCRGTQLNASLNIYFGVFFSSQLYISHNFSSFTSSRNTSIQSRQRERESNSRASYLQNIFLFGVVRRNNYRSTISYDNIFIVFLQYSSNM